MHVISHRERTLALVYRSHRSARHTRQRMRSLGYLVRLVAVAVSAVCITIEIPAPAPGPMIGPWATDVCPASSSEGVRR